MSLFFKQLEMSIALGPTMVTVAFITLFAVTLLWIYRPGSRKYYDQQANLPLEDGRPSTRLALVKEKHNG